MSKAALHTLAALLALSVLSPHTALADLSRRPAAPAAITTTTSTASSVPSDLEAPKGIDQGLRLRRPTSLGDTTRRRKMHMGEHGALLQISEAFSYARNNPVNFVDPTGTDAVYVGFPDYKIGIPRVSLPSVSLPLIGKVGGQEVGGWKQGGLGHAGVLLIDNKTGGTKYYEYGRYPTQDGIAGRVRNVVVPDVVMDKNGSPTTASLQNVLKAISVRTGHGTRVDGAYFKNDRFEAMNDYASQRLGEVGGREPYSICTNNCGTFAKSVIEAGGVDLPSMLDPRPNSYVEEAKSAADFPVRYGQ